MRTYRVLLAATMLLASVSWAGCKSSETFPVSEVEALLKAGLYDSAQVKLEKVVADCPESFKARQYMYQVSALRGNLSVATQHKVAAERIKHQQEKERSSSVMSFLKGLLMLMLALAISFAVYHFYIKRRYERRTSEEHNEVKQQIYTEVIALRQRLEDEILQKRLSSTVSTVYLDALKDARRIAADLVDQCYKDLNDLDVEPAKEFLRDANQLLQRGV